MAESNPTLEELSKEHNHSIACSKKTLGSIEQTLASIGATRNKAQQLVNEIDSPLRDNNSLSFKDFANTHLKALEDSQKLQVKSLGEQLLAEEFEKQTITYHTTKNAKSGLKTSRKGVRI